MAPTSDEELKIRLYSGDLSLLDPGEQFLKAIIDVPYAFKRMETLLFIFSLPEDISSIKQSFSSLEVLVYIPDMFITNSQSVSLNKRTISVNSVLNILHRTGFNLVLNLHFYRFNLRCYASVR